LKNFALVELAAARSLPTEAAQERFWRRQAGDDIEAPRELKELLRMIPGQKVRQE
jgi:hypothetical protein